MIKAFSILFSVFLIAGFVASNPVGAQTMSAVDRIGDWEISKSNTGEGALEVCLATKAYENGEAVIFYANGSSLTMGLLVERWGLDSSASYDIALQFNDYPRHPGKAIPGEDNKSVFFNLDFIGNIGEIRGSGNLYLHTAAGSLRFDIAGVDAALGGALDCVRENTPTSSE